MKQHTLIRFLHQQTFTRGALKFSANLRKKTSFQCNANAQAIFVPEDVQDLQNFVQQVSSEGYRYQQDFHVLGKGSNVLFEDSGYDGCLLDLCKLNKITSLDKNNVWKIHAQAGVGMGTLLQLLRKDDYTGFEFVFGIPGSIGGGIRMNAGTPAGWFSQVVSEVEGLSSDGTIFTKTVSEDDFLYRDFPFSHDKIITGGTFFFAQDSKENIENKIASAKEKRDKQPLTYPNFGSVFKNPTPLYAGALIEEVRLKGYQVGSVQISEKHANFMINHGDAKVSDVKQLIKTVQDKVYAEKGVVLETEVHILKKYLTE